LTVTIVIISTSLQIQKKTEKKKEKYKRRININFFADGNDGSWNPSSIRRRRCCHINMTFQVWSRGHIIGSRNRLK
jgi:hypothetical protein